MLLVLSSRILLPHHYPAMSYSPHISPVQCPLISQHTDSKLRSMLLLLVPSPSTLTCLPNSSLDSSLLHHVRRSLHKASLPSPVPPRPHSPRSVGYANQRASSGSILCSQRELRTHAWLFHWLFHFGGRGERCGFALGEKKGERLELDTAEGRGKECSVANSRTYRLPYF